MDKLRALQYFVAAAEGASLSAAARGYGVSVAAVSKLINALETQMEVRLLDRRHNGIALTSAGQAFLHAAKPALEQLAEAQLQAQATTSQARGTVVVGVQGVIAQEVLTAALPRFNALYPEIQLDVRHFQRMSDGHAQGLDAILVMGWPQQVEDFICKPIGATTYIVVASPAYWQAHGKPKHPSELEQHNCLCIRATTGSVKDLWHFRRGDERVSVSTRGRLVVDNPHRDMVRDLVIAGAGMAILLDWHQRPGREVQRGLFVPVLTEWVIDEVPPVNLLYPPSARRVPRVRVFIDWVTQLFAEVERERQRPLPSTTMPRWLKSTRPRASDTKGAGP
jgi:DNA-binding transcriptional LysR family regulator